MFYLERNKYLLDGLMNTGAHLSKSDLALVFLIELLFEVKVSDVGKFDTLGVIHDGEVSLIRGEGAFIHFELIVRVSCIEFLIGVEFKGKHALNQNHKAHIEFATSKQAGALNVLLRNLGTRF